MNLEKLKLTNYRNCEEIELNFDKNKILIIGKNAQGKTNILESIYFLSCLKTPRTSNIQELINFNKDFFKIEADVIKSNTDIDLSYSYTTDKKRELKINGTKSTIKDFKTVLKTVLFSTTDLLLLRGAPQDRRDWLDRAISQIYPAYDDRLTKYDKIRVQKNNFLKECAKTGQTNDALLDVYNEQLSITGSNIIYIRKKFLKEIEKIAQNKHRTISETENLSIKYDSNFLGINNDTENIEEIQIAFKNSLEERRIEEQRKSGEPAAEQDRTCDRGVQQSVEGTERDIFRCCQELRAVRQRDVDTVFSEAEQRNMPAEGACKLPVAAETDHQQRCKAARARRIRHAQVRL